MKSIRYTRKEVPLGEWEVHCLANQLRGKGGFLDISKCDGSMADWTKVPQLDPLEQQPDDSGMVCYRTNEKLMKKLVGGRRCMLEALVFATGMHLAELGCIGFSKAQHELGLSIHDMNCRLMKHAPFQLCECYPISNSSPMIPILSLVSLRLGPLSQPC